MIEQLTAIRETVKQSICDAEQALGPTAAIPVSMALLYAVRELDRIIARQPQVTPLAKGEWI